MSKVLDSIIEAYTPGREKNGSSKTTEDQANGDIHETIILGGSALPTVSDKKKQPPGSHN